MDGSGFCGGHSQERCQHGRSVRNRHLQTWIKSVTRILSSFFLSQQNSFFTLHWTCLGTDSITSQLIMFWHNQNLICSLKKFCQAVGPIGRRIQGRYFTYPSVRRIKIFSYHMYANDDMNIY
uniref:Uncharacterized protein n=1 Tax=Arundo donax TaxID=35708 RepID=A0A0A9FZY1_ARUDO